VAGGRAYLRVTVISPPLAAKPGEPAPKGGGGPPLDAVTCVNVADGKEVWRFETPGGGAKYGAPNTPCVADGRLYFVGSQYKVFCLDAGTGKEVWATELGVKGGTFSSSLLIAAGKAIVADARLSALDAKSGAKVWENADIQAEHNSPAAWTHQGKTYVIATHVPKAKKDAPASGGPKTLCVEVEDGKVVWELAAGGECASPSVGGDLLALSYEKLGLKVYRMTLAGATELGGAEMKAGSCTPAIRDGRVYGFGGEGGFCYDPVKSEFVWRSKPGGLSSSPIVADGKVIMFVGGASIALDLFDAADGRSLSPKRCQRTAAVRCSSPALADGKLLVNAGTHLRCYDLAKH
jgi:outer membrane protein assembly factor BamB